MHDQRQESLGEHGSGPKPGRRHRRAENPPPLYSPSDNIHTGRQDTDTTDIEIIDVTLPLEAIQNVVVHPVQTIEARPPRNTQRKSLPKENQQLIRKLLLDLLKFMGRQTKGYEEVKSVTQKLWSEANTGGGHHTPEACSVSYENRG